MAFLHRSRLQRHFSQGMRFIMVGGTAAVLELVTVTVLVEVLHVGEQLAGGISLVPSVIFVFFANKYFTFSAGKTQDRTELIRFAIVYAIAIAMNYALFSFFLQVFSLDYRIAKAGAIGIIACWNYCLSHAFIFKGKTSKSQSNR